jgi:uncharacterized membrane protein required for colicin V production
MNWIDIVVLVVWGFTALWGFSAGLIKIIFPLIAVIIGLAVSSRIAEDVGNVFSVVTDNEAAQAVGGFILIFLGLFIVSAILGFWAGLFLKFLPLFGLANRAAGMAVGVIIGFLLLAGVLTGVQRYADRMDDDIDESSLGAFLADNFDVVIRGVRLIPSDWDQEIDQQIKDLKEKLE